MKELMFKSQFFWKKLERKKVCEEWERENLPERKYREKWEKKFRWEKNIEKKNTEGFKCLKKILLTKKEW